MGKIKYLIPSAITTLSLWFAWQALMAESLVFACWQILKCAVFDKLDGTAARALKASSSIGVKLDSLHDAFAFGVVPGVLTLQLSSLMPDPVSSRFTQVAGVLYIVSTFYRLYKFDKLANSEASPDFFIGIPSTLAACIFASYTVAFDRLIEPHTPWMLSFPVLALGLALLMNGSFASLKMGKPDRRDRLMGQLVFFIGVSTLIFMQALPRVLFLISLMVLTVSIRGGRLKQRAHARAS